MTEESAATLALSRANAADDLVLKLEGALNELHGISSMLRKDKSLDRTQNRMFPGMHDALITLIERTYEPLWEARKRVVVHAYDERREAQ